jgi:hypothetical protein
MSRWSLGASQALDASQAPGSASTISAILHPTLGGGPGNGKPATRQFDHCQSRAP